jgi:hypothetical protein
MMLCLHSDRDASLYINCHDDTRRHCEWILAVYCPVVIDRRENSVRWCIAGKRALNMNSDRLQHRYDEISSTASP